MLSHRLLVGSSVRQSITRVIRVLSLFSGLVIAPVRDHDHHRRSSYLIFSCGSALASPLQRKIVASFLSSDSLVLRSCILVTKEDLSLSAGVK